MRLLHIFWDTNMNCRQDGLKKVAKKEGGITLDDLKMGDMLCFINRAKNRIATLTKIPEGESYGVMGYYRSPGERKIALCTLKYIPDSFNSMGELDMDKVTRSALLEQLGIKEGEVKRDARGQTVVIRRKG